MDTSRLCDKGGSNRKLTAAQVRAARLSMDTNEALARRYRVDPGVISNARSGRFYGTLKPDEQAAHDKRQTVPDQRVPFSHHQLIVSQVPTVGPLDMQDRQEAMDAAHECAHGRLPHDSTPPCGCWPQEILKTNPNPRRNHVHHSSPERHDVRVARLAAQATEAGHGRQPDHRPARAGSMA